MYKHPRSSIQLFLSLSQSFTWMHVDKSAMKSVCTELFSHSCFQEIHTSTNFSFWYSDIADCPAFMDPNNSIQLLLKEVSKWINKAKLGGGGGRGK